MSNLYDNFEKRFTNNWFAMGWTDSEVEETAAARIARKDAATLEAELAQINETIENVAQKQLRLANLAQLYNN